MYEQELKNQERWNTGSSWTRNEQFDKDGYLVVKDLWDPEELYHPLPEDRGQLNYWDNNYFPGQELTKHADRDACEISVSVHIGTNLKGKDAKWPFKIKTPDTYTDKKKTEVLVPGEERSLSLEPGDGLLYKGCERPHWRDPMPTPKRRLFGNNSKEYYYHQIFFHYVLQDGQRAHCAWDRAR